MKYFFLALMFLFSTQIYAQSLFENAVSGDYQDSDTVQDNTYEIGGYLRGVSYVGEAMGADEIEAKSSYAESSLKIRVSKQSFGDGFAEIRFRRGYEFGKAISNVNLREAYVNAYMGKFDFRIGHQIVVWGRADGLNPTDNITPKNMLARSPDEDDKREGNFLVRSSFNLHPARIEAIWVPVYSASAIATDLVSLPPGVSIGHPEFPNADLENSAFAIRGNVELASLDGSISYFNGYNPFPGIGTVIADGMNIVPTAYRIHVLGADFSTTIGSFLGLRGEFAYREPHEDYEKNIHIPNPDIQYVIGGDREIGDISLIIQYLGRYVLDFSDITEPTTQLEAMAHKIARYNRLYSYQQDEISHSISFRGAWKLLHETLDLELSGLYNITTEELLLRSKVSYDIADALTLTAGLERYSGASDTLFGMLDNHLNALYIELKTSF